MVEGNKNKVKLLICYHKPAYLLKDNVMTPIHVGRANAKVRMGEENPDYQWLVNNMKVLAYLGCWVWLTLAIRN